MLDILLKAIIRLFCVAALLQSNSNWAVQEGKGGDTNCAAFADTVTKIVNELKVLGQSKLDLWVPLIHVDKLEGIRDRFKCTPVESLVKNRINSSIEPSLALLDIKNQAESFPEKGETVLNITVWPALSPWQQLRLVAHELMILAEYEGSGQYFISVRMLEFLQNYSLVIRRNAFGKDVQLINPSTITVLKPHLIIDGQEYRLFSLQGDRSDEGNNAAAGFCKRLGFGKASDYFYEAYKKAKLKVVLLNQAGGYKTTSEEIEEGAYVYRGITCKR